MKRDIKDLTIDALTARLTERGLEPYRAVQILKWIYIRQVDDFQEMTDLKKEIRSLLADHFTIDRLRRIETETAADGTRKYLFGLRDGARIESVLIPEKDHFTLCISSQVGCALGCRFCLTARQGLVRNLTAGEIAAQVRDIRNDLPDPARLTNIVFMGMGEPLANLENVAAAIDVITNGTYGMNFSTRRVTVSTAGLVPRFADLKRLTRVNYALSLNAADDATRSLLMPVNRTYPLDAVVRAAAEHLLRDRRKLMLEYVLISGVNDAESDARRLVRLAHPLKAKINLISFNENPFSDFKRPDDDAIQCFRDVLFNKHFTVVVRQSKGREISAACGQLGAGRNRGQNW